MKKHCIISILSLALTLPLQAQADTTLTPPTPRQGDFACKLNYIVSKGLARAEAQCLRMAAKMADSTDVVPRSFTHSGRFQTVTITAWTSGFFPGTLWYLYEATGNETLRRHADYYYVEALIRLRNNLKTL